MLMVHHGVTITLLLVSYIINMVPIGLVIAVLHDVADVFLEVCSSHLIWQHSRTYVCYLPDGQTVCICQVLNYSQCHVLGLFTSVHHHQISSATQLVRDPSTSLLLTLLACHHRVLPSLMFDLPHYIGGHSYITWAAVVLIMGLLVCCMYWQLCCVDYPRLPPSLSLYISTG